MEGHNRGIMPIETILRQDEFAEQKCLYELSSAVWLLARRRNDVMLLRKSARRMLFHLKMMYSLANAK